MNRHNSHANGYRGYPSKDGSGYPLSPHRSVETRSMRPHLMSPRFQARSPAQRRRKQLLTRLAIAGSISCLLLIILFPSIRTFFVSVLSLGLLSGPETIQLETVRYYDLSDSGGSARGWEREERVLMCAPLRDAQSHLPMFFSHLRNLIM